MSSTTTIHSQRADAIGPAPRAKIRNPKSRIRNFFWCLPFLLAGLCFWNGLPSAQQSPESAATAAIKPSAVAEPIPALKRTLVTRPIQDIRPGQRVIAKNPELDGQDVPQVEIDPESTRLVSLHLTKPDGHEVEIDTLMSLDELLAVAVENLEEDTNVASPVGTLPRPLIGSEEDVSLNELLIGQFVEINLPELGVEGPAAIKAIHPCPLIEPDDGTGRRLVTSVFRHSAANVIDLETRGSSETIGVTANHPFWSEDRQGFVHAGELTPGENLRRADGTFTQVSRLTPRTGPPVAVYNFEVDGEHVYSVGATGLVVHNDCSLAQLSKNAAAGKAGEKVLVSLLGKLGFKVVAQNVLVKTTAGRREIDIVVQLGKKYFGIEVKSGNAVRTAMQIAKDKLINGTVDTVKFFGRKARAVGLDGKVLEAIWEAGVP